jgi:hypothetical protein
MVTASPTRTKSYAQAQTRNNKDTDGDGIGDGVEVYYRMNPLDADMDNDGVNDGQEVAQGSDPFFPDQATDISPELNKEVSDFITRAIQLQIEAYRQGNANIAASIMAGDIFAALENEISASQPTRHCPNL